MKMRFFTSARSAFHLQNQPQPLGLMLNRLLLFVQLLLLGGLLYHLLTLCMLFFRFREFTPH